MVDDNVINNENSDEVEEEKLDFSEEYFVPFKKFKIDELSDDLTIKIVEGHSKRFEIVYCKKYDMHAIYDKVKEQFVMFDEDGTIDKDGNNCGPWMTQYSWNDQDTASSHSFSYYSYSKGILNVSINHDSGKFFKYEYDYQYFDDYSGVIEVERPLNAGNSAICDTAYLYSGGGDLIDPDEYGYSARIVRHLKALEKGYLIFKDVNTDTNEYEYFYVEPISGNKSTKTYDSLGSLLKDIECVKMSIDGKTFIYRTYKNLGFSDGWESRNFIIQKADGDQKVIQKIKLSEGYSGQYEVVDYNYYENFAVILKKYPDIEYFIYFPRMVGDSDYDMKDDRYANGKRQYTDPVFKLPEKLDYRKQVSLSDILRLKPELFKYLPTHFFGNNEVILGYLDAIVEGLIECMPDSTKEWNDSSIIADYQAYVQLINKLIADKIQVESQTINQQISDSYSIKSAQEEEEEKAKLVAERQEIVRARTSRKLAEAKAKNAKVNNISLSKIKKDIVSLKSLGNF